MATYTDAGKMAQAQRDRAAKMRHSMTAGSRECADILLAEAKKLTAGTTSSKQLAAAGHPFAKSRARDRFAAKYGKKSALASYPLTPINKQSGDLQSKWRIFRYKRADGEEFRLQNMSRHAKYILAAEGASRMVARGALAELSRRALPKIRRVMKSAHSAGNRSK